MDPDAFFAVREVEETLQRTIPRQAFGRSDMDSAASVHQPDAVRDLQRQLQVVGGKEDRLAGLPGKAMQQMENVHLAGIVQKAVGSSRKMMGVS